MSHLKDKYVNPLTDFGFKRLFVFKHLSKLQDRPKALQDRVFERLFEAAEIAKFSPEERDAYEDSLKYYRDLKNVVDTSREEGREEGREAGKEEGREEERFTIAREMKANGEPIEKIIQYTRLSMEEIERL